MHIRQAALAARIQVLAGAQAFGDCRLDLSFELTDPVMLDNVGSQSVSGVSETETHRGCLVGGLQTDLGDHRLGINNVFAQVVDDLALFVGAVLPITIDRLGQVGAHRCGADDGANVTTPRTRLGIGVSGAATTTHLDSSSDRFGWAGDKTVSCTAANGVSSTLGAG